MSVLSLPTPSPLSRVMASAWSVAGGCSEPVQTCRGTTTAGASAASQILGVWQSAVCRHVFSGMNDAELQAVVRDVRSVLTRDAIDPDSAASVQYDMVRDAVLPTLDALEREAAGRS